MDKWTLNDIMLEVKNKKKKNLQNLLESCFDVGDSNVCYLHQRCSDHLLDDRVQFRLYFLLKKTTSVLFTHSILLCHQTHSSPLN